MAEITHFAALAFDLIEGGLVAGWRGPAQLEPSVGKKSYHAIRV